MSEEKHDNPTLPPDPEDMNNDRANWAQIALEAFTAATGTDREDAICDLIADLGHWCDRNNMNLEVEIQRGAWHYDAETGGEGKQLEYTGEAPREKDLQ